MNKRVLVLAHKVYQFGGVTKRCTKADKSNDFIYTHKSMSISTNTMSRVYFEGIVRLLSTLVHQKQFDLSVNRAKVSKLRFLQRMATELNIPSMEVRIYRNLKLALEDLGLIAARSKWISAASFNINALCDNQCLTTFRF